MIKFEGFTVPDNQKLIASVMILKTASAKAKAALLSGDLTQFRTWFDGTGKNAHLMKVSSIVKEIDDAIRTRPITFVNATGNAIDRGEKGLCGYVWLMRNRGPGDKFSKMIHVGSGMRILLVPRTHGGKIGDIAETMYHELSHNKVGGTKDITYNVNTCKRNALHAPQQAALNAENYNRFLGEYLQ